MNNYNQYFIFDEKFVKKYSPYPGISFDSPIEQIHLNDGPLKSVDQFDEFMKAFLDVLEEHGVEKHANELLYFATLISRVERESISSIPVSNSVIKRQEFLEELKAFPLDFEYRGVGDDRYVWFEEDEPETDKLKQLYILPEKKIKKAKSLPSLRAKAHETNYYYDVKTGEPTTPNHRQIEISRHIEITIKSTLDNKSAVVVPDMMLNEQAISSIIGTMLNNQKLCPEESNHNNIGRPRMISRAVVAKVSRCMLKYISNKTGMKKPKGDGVVSTTQATFLFDYFALLGWLEKKANHNLELEKSTHKNQFQKQLHAFKRTYCPTIEHKTQDAKYIRDIIISS